MKLVVVNSTGPMGSSVVSALLEKFGYLNIPARNYGLHEYLVNLRSIDDDHIKNQFETMFKIHGKETKRGGVNMEDRDSGKPQCLIDFQSIEKKVVEMRAKPYRNISDLYREYRDTYASAIKYKNSAHVAGKHVEVTTEFNQYIDSGICQAYENEFDDVVLIHLHRNFSGWIESIASQRFSSKKKKFKFFLHRLYKRYMDYESESRDCPGVHIDFEELFQSDNNVLVRKVANALGEPVPMLDWESEKYDLYGKLTDFNKTFTKADVDGRYLSKSTRWVIYHFAHKKKITLLHDAIVYFFYFFDLIRFRRNN